MLQRVWVNIWTIVLLLLIVTAQGTWGAKVVLMAWSDPARWQGLVNGFLADNPDWPHEVEVQVTANSGAPYREKLLAMLAGGTGPDIWLVDPSWLEFDEWARTGIVVEELDPYIKRDGVSLDTMWPVFKDIGGANGKLYALPLHVIPQTMYYNRTYIEELGVADPAAQYLAGTWTFANLVTAAKASTIDKNGDGQFDHWGVESGLMSTWQLWSYVWTSGGDFFDLATGKSTADAPGTIRGIEFVYDLIHTHKVATAPGTGSVQGFVQGLFTFMQNWGSAPGSFVRNTYGIMEFDWAVVPPPKADATAKHYTPTTVGLWVMNKESKVKDAAWDLLKWLGSAKGNEAWLRATYFHGIAHPAIFQSKYFRDLISQPGWDKNLATIYYDLYMHHARWRPSYRKMADWERLSDQYIVMLRNGQMAVRTAMEELTRLTDALMAE